MNKIGHKSRDEFRFKVESLNQIIKKRKNQIFSLGMHIFSNFFFFKYFSVDKLTNAKKIFWLAIFYRKIGCINSGNILGISLLFRPSIPYIRRTRLMLNKNKTNSFFLFLLKLNKKKQNKTKKNNNNNKSGKCKIKKRTEKIYLIEMNDFFSFFSSLYMCVRTYTRKSLLFLCLYDLYLHLHANTGRILFICMQLLLIDGL